MTKTRQLQEEREIHEVQGLIEEPLSVAPIPPTTSPISTTTKDTPKFQPLSDSEDDESTFKNSSTIISGQDINLTEDNDSTSDL